MVICEREDQGTPPPRAVLGTASGGGTLESLLVVRAFPSPTIHWGLYLELEPLMFCSVGLSLSLKSPVQLARWSPLCQANWKPLARK